MNPITVSPVEIPAILQGVFRDIFDQPNLTIGRQTSAADIEEWDSLAHVNLVVAVEKKFGIEFALGELQALKNVGEMIDLIAAKLQK